MGSQFAATTALFFSFLLALLLLVVLGSSSYRHTAAGLEANQASQAGRAYLLSRLRAADQAGMVSVAPGPEGDVLVLAEAAGDEVYETRIYLAGGQLVEEYLPAGTASDPAAAQPVCTASAFAVHQEGATLALTVDGTSCTYALRSAEEGRP